MTNKVESRWLRKPFYGLEEMCIRWGMSVADAAAFVLNKDLKLSVPVAKLLVDFGVWEQTTDDEWFRVPHGQKMLSGPVDLFADDAWWALQAGSQTVFRLVPEEDGYLDIASVGDEARGLAVAAQDLVLRQAEVERFESVHGLGHVQISTISGTPPSSDSALRPRRGAVAQYDWDAFWREVARSMHFDGVPESQAEFVRRMVAWFDSRGEHPDPSTIKKKLSPLWREIAPEAERKLA